MTKRPILIITFLALAALLSANAFAAAVESQPTTMSAATSQPVTTMPTTAPTSGPAVLEVVYFYSPTCLKCHEAEKTVDAVEKKFGDQIRVRRFSIATDEGLEMMLTYEDHYGSKENPAPPKVFVGEKYLAGLEDIAKNLDQLVTDELARLRQDPHAVVAPLEADANRLLTKKQFSSFTLGTVIGAGLIDGVNPCAFTTIVFMLSMLTYLGKSRRDMVIVSMAFTVAVFLTYLLIGISILVVIKNLAVDKGISRTLTYVIAALTFALAGWSMIDAIRFSRSGKVAKGSLGLPNSIKQRIHKVIRNGLKTKYLVAGAFSVGVLVSVLESLCTGQVYLPTIVIMLQSSDKWLTAAIYLVLYNLMFIIPLVVLTVLSYYGIGSQKLGAFLGRHVGLAKVMMSLLFVGLGIMLLVTAYR